MTALTAANVTITPDDNSRRIRESDGRRECVGAIAFGNSALTYPSLGVPLPSAQAFGMPRKLEEVEILSPQMDGYGYVWDNTNKSIRIFYPTSASSGPHSGDEVATTFAPAAISLFCRFLGK